MNPTYVSCKTRGLSVNRRQWRCIALVAMVSLASWPALGAPAPSCDAIFAPVPPIPKLGQLNSAFAAWLDSIPIGTILEKELNLNPPLGFNYPPPISPTPKLMRESFGSVPQHIGLLYMFKGHLFLGGYFMNYILGKLDRENFTSLDAVARVSAEQPWGEWNARAGKWNYHGSGAGPMLKSLLPSRVTLNRGLSPTEAKLYTDLQAKLQGLSESEALDLVRQVIPEGNFICTSPNDIERFWAQGFDAGGRKKVVVQSTVNIADLVADEDIYLGVEIAYIELNLLSDRAKLAFIRGLRTN